MKFGVAFKLEVIENLNFRFDTLVENTFNSIVYGASSYTVCLQKGIKLAPF